MMAMSSRIDMINAGPTHNGDKTHYHDHAIYPVSFNPMNRTARSEENPKPELTVVVSLAIGKLLQLPFLVQGFQLGERFSPLRFGE